MPTVRNARNWNRGHKTLFLFLLPLDWRGYTATYSALVCDLLEQSQSRNTELPKSARNDQKDDSKPWLNTSQSNASALAIHLHHQDAEADAGGWPSGTPHTSDEAPSAWL